MKKNIIALLMVFTLSTSTFAFSFDDSNQETVEVIKAENINNKQSDETHYLVEDGNAPEVEKINYNQQEKVEVLERENTSKSDAQVDSYLTDVNEKAITQPDDAWDLSKVYDYDANFHTAVGTEYYFTGTGTLYVEPVEAWVYVNGQNQGYNTEFGYKIEIWDMNDGSKAETDWITSVGPETYRYRFSNLDPSHKYYITFVKNKTIMGDDTSEIIKTHGEIYN